MVLLSRSSRSDLYGELSSIFMCILKLQEPSSYHHYILSGPPGGGQMGQFSLDLCYAEAADLQHFHT